MQCPVCKKTVPDPPADPAVPMPEFFPFCSERCRLVDLGRWFDEDYKIARPLTAEEDLEE